MVAAGDVIALRAGLAALAFLGAGQLFEFAVKFFDLPTHVVRVLSDLRGQVISSPLVMSQSMSPFGATSLNNLTLNGTFFSLTTTPVWSLSGVHSMASF
ncbi:hypothetical protein [Candidatus Methylobacter oryzae]|uniref:Secreted protein n=1 Tax=Candidatus Methylobacter oryzae TaxID=2497749 RepID=A0ABY3CCQ2_9GAMM|nr:hypothetical protein [Candidatus Methylobacter oryzae]TRX00049.1 hypothetical protein EKO24_006335 [Candidatus Methylobacter oryzae]